MLELFSLEKGRLTSSLRAAGIARTLTFPIVTSVWYKHKGIGFAYRQEC